MSELILPAPSTVAKYGMTLDEWKEMAGKVCRICEQPKARMVVDHLHVPGWKKMPPELRRKYVRGVVCTVDNHYVLTRYGTPLKHRNAAIYLEEFEERLASW